MQEDISGFETSSKPLEPLTVPVATCPRRQVTAEDLKTFQRSPFQVVEKQFILHPNESERDGGNILCQIVGARMSKAEGTWFQVQIEGCGSSIEMSAQEMMEIFKDSLLLGPEESGMDGISRLLDSAKLNG
jgi:hypothetical protein